jgi:uncharacterized membrane protein
MDLHPVFIHFPIALLTLYAVFELLQVKKLTGQVSWLYIKSTLLIIGTLGAYAALQTGEIARGLNHPVNEIVSYHEDFADWTTAIFTTLSVNYLLLLVSSFFAARIPERYQSSWVRVMDIRKKIFNPTVLFLLAFIGLVTLTITGAFGGIMMYGPTSDPVTTLVSKIFLSQ